MMLISDFADLVDSKCLDANDINLWKAIPYEAEGLSGNMLASGYGADLSPIEVKLSVKGKYRIWLGMYGFTNHFKIRARLGDDLCFQTISPPAILERQFDPVLFEVYWKEADLTGQNLMLEGNLDPNSYQGALAFIRLEEIDENRAKSDNDAKCPLAITEDGSGIFNTVRHKKPEDLLEPFESVPLDSDMRILLWGNGDADVCNYPTKVGNHHTYPPGRSLSYRYELTSNNHQLWESEGWNSMEIVRDYAAKRDWEFHVYIRMEAFGSQFPFDFIQSKFFNSHPEYHCHDREGQPVMRLSYAHSEVQQHMLDLIQEISQYNPDGVNLCFTRGVPVVLYEPIMIDGFMEKYGVDPRELDEFDERWLEYQAVVFTPFIEQAKAILKPTQRLSVMVPANEKDCRRWGMDVAEWVRRGIIDDLYPVGQVFTPEDVHIDCPENLDFDYFNSLAGRKKIRLIPMLYPWNKFCEDYEGWKKTLVSFKKKGADAYAVWDAIENNDVSRFKRIDHITKSQPSSEFETRCVKLITLNGFRYDRYHHFEVV